MASKIVLGKLRKLLEDAEEEDEEDELEERCDNDDDDDWSARAESESEHDAGSDEEAEYWEESDVAVENETFFLSRDKRYKWRKDPSVSVAKIVGRKYDPEVRDDAKNARTPEEALDLFVTSAMVDTMIECTNKFIQTAAPTINVPHQYAMSVDSDEMYAFLGLLYLAGTCDSKRRNLKDLWADDGTGIPVFRATMSYFRFRFLLCCLQFDDRATRGARAKIDKLAAIRHYLEEFVANCKRRYGPSDRVILDEMFRELRGRCPFKRRVPVAGKPTTKYGVKMYALVDTQTRYTSNLEIHIGEQPVGVYKLSYAPVRLVERMIEPISGTGRNVTMNDRFTSVALSRRLLEAHELTVVGAMRRDSPEIPAEFVRAGERSVTSYTFGFIDDVTLISYAPREKMATLLLSTVPTRDNELQCVSNGERKPELVEFYDATRNGVDAVDRMCALFDVCYVSNKSSWPLAIFFTIMNIAAINAMVVFYLNTGRKMSRRKFLKTLGLSMIEKWCHRRQQQQGVSRHPEGLKRTVVAVTDEEQQQISRKRRLGRCMVCPRTKDRKTNYRCAKCEKLICLEHVVSICADCAKWPEWSL